MKHCACGERLMHIQEIKAEMCDHCSAMKQEMEDPMDMEECPDIGPAPWKGEFPNE